MRIIVNRGFDKTFTRIVVFSNNQKIVDCPIKQDYCEFESKKGERFLVKLRYSSRFAFTIASICCHDHNDTLYITPVKMFKVWMLINYMMFPCGFLLFYILQKTNVSDLYDSCFTGLVVLWALSLIFMGFSHYIPWIRKKMFKTIKL